MMAGSAYAAGAAAQGAVSALPARTFLGQLTSTTSGLSTYNLGNITVPADGLLVAVIIARTGASVSVASVSLDGGAAALYGANTASASPKVIAARRVMAGSRAVSVTFSGGTAAGNALTVGLFLITGTLASDTPIGFDEVVGASATSRTVTFDRGVGVAVFGAYTATTNTTFSYSSAASDLNASLTNTTTVYYSYASLVTTAGTAVSEVVTYGTSTLGNFIGAAWA